MTKIDLTHKAPVNAVTLQILELFNRGRTVLEVVRIGEYRGSWTRADVKRVVDTYLAPRPVKREQQHRPRRRVPVPRPPLPPTQLTPWQPPPVVATLAVRINDQEAKILYGICEGATNAAIARRLDTSESYVANAVGRMMIKLGVRSRVSAAVLAVAQPHSIMVEVRK